MNMLSRSILSVAACISITATVAMANTVTLYQGNYSYSVGGEFTAVTSQNFLGDGYVSSTEQVAGGQTGFQTFCIETGVDFTPGTPYTYTLGNSTAPDSGAAGSGLNLSVGTAYLYYEFATGNLTGYNYANTGLGLSRNSDAGLLQAAIWALQGGQTYSGYAVPTISNNSYYAAALAYCNSLGISATSVYDGSSVDILQLWVNSNDTDPAQNQLVLTGNGWSVPDGGMTVMLLGVAIIVMFLFQSLYRKVQFLQPHTAKVKHSAK
jgi:hypothetical protein